MEKNKNKTVAGLMILGLIVIGAFGLFAGVLSMFNEYNYLGTGLCLIASALAFGAVLKSYS